MMFISGCSLYQKEIVQTNEDLRDLKEAFVYSLPDFPKPHPNVVIELKEACQQKSCQRLYDWLGKLLVLQKQLEILREKNDHEKGLSE